MWYRYLLLGIGVGFAPGMLRTLPFLVLFGSLKLRESLNSGKSLAVKEAKDEREKAYMSKAETHWKMIQQETSPERINPKTDSLSSCVEGVKLGRLRAIWAARGDYASPDRLELFMQCSGKYKEAFFDATQAPFRPIY